jgi:hypothetical protein
MTHSTAALPANPPIAQRGATEARRHRSVDIDRLGRQLEKAFAALAANQRYPGRGAPDVDGRLHDQARIMRLLFVCGAQAAIDIGATPRQSRTRSRILTTVGRDAGCQTSDASAAVQDLCASGLVRFARQALNDPHRYSQIDHYATVATTVHAAAAPSDVRGALRLTPRGETLCRSSSAPDTPIASPRSLLASDRIRTPGVGL